VSITGFYLGIKYGQQRKHQGYKMRLENTYGKQWRQIRRADVTSECDAKRPGMFSHGSRRLQVIHRFAQNAALIMGSVNVISVL
jgi:hypothetical protein